VLLTVKSFIAALSHPWFRNPPDPSLGCFETGETMLTVNSVSKRFGDTPVLETITCVINRGDRIGLIGPNGAGKTTLLRLIIGVDRPDTGSITIAPDTRIGYLRQGFTDVQTGTLADLLDIPTDGLLAAQADIERATNNLADPEIEPQLAADRYDDALNAFEAKGGYAGIDELNALLAKFDLDGVTMDRPLSTLSGGQKTRAGLAGLLASRPDLLILDEPTNHLDAEAQAWLAGFLQGYRSAVLIVSHDRGFLDDVITRVFALDPLTHQLAAYAGNYSDYAAAKQHEEEEHAANWQRQQKEVRRIEQDIRAAESKARGIEAGTIDYAIRKKAAKIARPAVVRKAKLERMLESTEAIEKPVRLWGMAASFAGSANGPRDVATLDDVSVTLGHHPVLEHVSLQLRHGDRLAITGPNGAGKTTLLRLLTGELAADSGVVRLGPGVRVGYFAQEQESLDLDLTVLEQARQSAAMPESDIRTFLHKYLFGGDTVYRTIGDLSYGERARLMLALMALRGTELLLLDEPLNHLDIDARESFERALEQYEGTLAFVVHDRYAIDRLATRVLELRDGALVDAALVNAS
jgi:ATP-binding cassette subfamily F protein 3